ncbi:MAG: hypothetical protein HYR73_01780, partial [Candidatus Eisenbacteria bacterium]|nr:hypothetical protein [Candidatus Eisenbacteria bacterium]
RVIRGGGGIEPDVVVSDTLHAEFAPPSERAALISDPVFRRAAELLRHARAPRDVFASLPAPRAGTSRR